jgi:hypothetical protein
MQLGQLEAEGVTCDVLVLDAGYRTILQHVPLMLQSAGLNDYEGWIPRDSSIDIVTAVMQISPEGLLGVPVSNAEDLDGDFVMIGFMADDLNQPVILGQLPHPRNKKRPKFTDLTKFKYRRVARGISWGVTNTGNVEIDLSTPTHGTVIVGGEEVVVPPPAAGNVLVKMGPLAFLTIADSVVSAPSLALMGGSYLTSLSTFQASEASILAAMNTFATASNAYGAAAATAIGALAVDPALLPATATALGIWATAATTWATAATTWAGVVTTHITAQGVIAGEVTTSLGAGLPFLSSHLEFD